MKLHYIKADPTGNITLLVDTPVPRALQASAAFALMRQAGGEQAGFLEAPTLPGARLRLQMMGGEFCGNASMSAAAYLAHRDALPDGAADEYPIEVSGAAEMIRCRIRRQGEAYLGTVPMPLPKRMMNIRCGEGSFPVVVFEGILHCIVPEGCMNDGQAEAFAREQCVLQEADAFGVLLLNAEMDSFRPLVYVRATDSAVWEHGCGSGTAAIGVWRALSEGGEASLRLSQPGGAICVRAVCEEGRIIALSITGKVCFAEEASVEIQTAGIKSYS